MRETKRAPRFAWVQIDRRPRGWGSVRDLARGVAFPAVIGIGLLVWCVHGFTRHDASRPAALYLVSLSLLCLAMLYISLGFTFLIAVVRGWVPAAVAFVGRGRTVIFQGGVIPRFVSYGGGSGAYDVTHKVSSIGNNYWAVQRGSSAKLGLGAFDNHAVTENDDRRLSANFERLNAAEASVRGLQ